MESFIDRLFEFIASRGLSQNKFEELCGLTHTNLREKRQGPTAAYLMRIISTFPELSLDWLFRGTGSMTVGEFSQHSPSVHIENAQTVNIGNWGELVELLKAQKQ